MLYEKALEPLSLPLPTRQFLESLRSGQLSEAFLNLNHIECLNPRTEDRSLFTASLSLLAFANALFSQARLDCCEFLLDQGFNPLPHREKLLDYLLLSARDQQTGSNQEALEWLFELGARVEPARKLAWRSLETYYPRLFLRNQALIERQALDQLLTSDLPEVSEARETIRL